MSQEFVCNRRLTNIAVRLTYRHSRRRSRVIPGTSSVRRARSRDQHVILIVLTRASPTDSRLVRKLLHTLTTQPHRNYAKYHQKHSTAEDSSQPSSFFAVMPTSRISGPWGTLRLSHNSIIVSGCANLDGQTHRQMQLGMVMVHKI